MSSRPRTSSRSLRSCTGCWIVYLVLASASALAQRLCAVWVLAQDATALYRALNAFRKVARAYLDLPPAAREVS
jgi:hypothetical protein